MSDIYNIPFWLDQYNIANIQPIISKQNLVCKMTRSLVPSIWVNPINISKMCVSI